MVSPKHNGLPILPNGVQVIANIDEINISRNSMNKLSMTPDNKSKRSFKRDRSPS